MKLPLLLLLSCICFVLKAQVVLQEQAALKKPEALSFDSLTKKKIFFFSGHGFKGEGWDLLQKEVNKSKFVLIGEQHGEAEVPLFAGAVADVLKPNALVVELDPYTAKELQKVSDEKRYAQVLQDNPYAFAFYSWQQEMDLIGKVRRVGAEIWGLNEINFLSMATFFRQLAEASTIPGNRKYATALSKKYADYDRPFYKTGEFGKFSAYQIKATLVDSLLVTFKNDQPICRKMLTDLKQSIPIFKNTSYLQRVSLMKKNLLNYVSRGLSKDTIDLPKLLFKFGANHVTRSDDMTGAFEAGNLADNLASAAGEKTLHILVFGKAGTINGIGAPDNSKAIVPYDIAQDGSLKMMTAFTDPLEGDQWAVYDLRTMRRAIIQGKYVPTHEDFKAMVMGYDLLVTFAKTSGSRFYE